MRKKVCRWRQEPLSGFLVHGSNGEFAYLSPKERVDVIRVVKEEVALFFFGVSADRALNCFAGWCGPARSGWFRLRVNP